MMNYLNRRIFDLDNKKKQRDNVKNDDIDILINNAGFGLIGVLSKTNLDRELSMIDLNVKAVHVLTKLFLKDFVKEIVDIYLI